MTGPIGLHYELYQPGEWLMRIAPARPSQLPPILFIPPLFEELNRTRALIAAMMRRLAARGHECRLPDLPGAGESERRIEEIGWDDWRHAVSALGRDHIVASLRGGCLIDDLPDACGHWRMAPVSGASLRRDLDRASLTGGAAAAGYPASPALLDALKAAEPATVLPLRVVRLANDAGEADAKLQGPALWRRSEPGQSAELARHAADDLAEWAEQCADC